MVFSAGTASTLLTRPSGRAVAADESWSVAVGQLRTRDRVREAPAAVAAPGAAADPAAGLTFDLRLTAEQRAQRARVVLPYTREGGSHASMVAAVAPDKPDSDDESELMFV
jgi:hypothetical protein